MADSKSLGWEIEKIVDCNGDDMTDTDNGWVRIHPMSGKGSTKAQVSVDTSSYWYDCKEAVVTISAETGDKKYITINRCNPECNCDAVGFSARTITDKVKAEGQIIEIADYEMKYCCDGKNSIGLVNTDAYCDYYFEETIDEDDPCKITGVVKADVKENTNTDSERFFSYYVTYNGVRCNQIPLEGNAFIQEKAKDPCETETKCPTVYTNVTEVSYRAQTIEFTLEDFTDCWTLEIGEYWGQHFDIRSSGDNFVELYIEENTDYNNSQEYVFSFLFINKYLRRDLCDFEIEITQDAKPFVPTCKDCDDYQIGKWTAQQTKFPATGYTYDVPIASFSANCMPDSKFSITHISGGIICNNPRVVLNQGKNYFVVAKINENNSYSEVKEYFNLIDANGRTCTNPIFITQSGKDPEPVEYCEIIFGNVSFKCDENKKLNLIINAWKKDSICQIETTARYEIHRAIQVGGVWRKEEEIISEGVFEVTGVTADSNEIIDISGEGIGIGAYYIDVINTSNESNRVSHRNNITEPCLDEITIRFQISTQSSDTYLLTIDNFICYLKNRESGDKICFPLTTSNWKGEYLDLNDMANKVGDVDEGQFVPLSPVVKTDCDFCKYMYTMELGSQPNISKLYTKIYQDVIISKAEYNIIEGEIEHYDLYVVEKYATRGGSPTSSSDIKLRNSASPTAIPVKWGLYDGSNLYVNGSYLLTGHLDEYVCENEDNDYRTRINFIYSGSSSCSNNSEDYCLTVGDFEHYDYGEYNSLFEVRLWPKEQSMAREGELDDDNVDETNNDVEVTDGNNK